VELLVVIAIIGLLVGIIVPSLQQAKVFARQGRVNALIKVLGTGLEMVNSDPAIGGDYPPSIWNTAGSPGGNPYAALGQNDPNKPTSGDYVAYGAQTLIWALAGADLLGAPGFNGNLTDLYAMSGSRPRMPRSGPFVDVTKLEVRYPIVGRDIYLYSGYNARQNVPVIMDDFDNPILYYRANQSQLGMARYAYLDNLPFCNPVPNSWNEANRAVSDWIACPNQMTFSDNRQFDNGFEGFIHNYKVVTVAQPYDYDSYLLLSAGPDGLYGTRDDIGNFPVNVANLPQGY
jgi:type II secretory pathway pseudopilin PulG